MVCGGLITCSCNAEWSCRVTIVPAAGEPLSGTSWDSTAVKSGSASVMDPDPDAARMNKTL